MYFSLHLNICQFKQLIKKISSLYVFTIETGLTFINLKWLTFLYVYLI